MARPPFSRDEAKQRLRKAVEAVESRSCAEVVISVRPWSTSWAGIDAAVGAGLAYRPLLLRGWTDTAGQRRADRYLGFGLAHVIALELSLEVRDPLARW